MTGMYNVLEKIRKEEPLTDKDRKIHDQGLVSVLRQIHDEIDAATLEAYGWPDLSLPALSQSKRSNGEELNGRASPAQRDKPSPLADRLAAGNESAEALEQQILQRLVDLNHERAAEEAQGKIRWLRPEYQDPESEKSEDRSLESEKQTELPGTETPQVSGLKPPPSTKLPWPKDLPARVSLIQRLGLKTEEEILPTLEGRATAKRKKEVREILDTLEVLGWR